MEQNGIGGMKMLARVTGSTFVGIEGRMVDVEVYLSSQLPSYDIL